MDDVTLLAKLNGGLISELSTAERLEAAELSQRIETAWVKIAYVVPRLFPELGDDPSGREAQHVIQGHCAVRHGMSAIQVRQMPICDLADLLERDLSPQSTGAEPLTDSQQAAFDFIKANPGKFGTAICKACGISEESTFTKHYVPALKRHGVKNRRGYGYYVE